MSRPRIAITMGDPAGIGPELALKCAAAPEFAAQCDVVIYGDRDFLLAEAAKYIPGVTPEIVHTGSIGGAFVPGKASPVCGRSACEAVRQAVRDTLSGRTDAIVTAPMNKYSVNLSGMPFTGHTEFIAEMCGVPEVVMMQSADKLRMVFVTTHIAISEVARAVTPERISRVCRLLHETIKTEQPNQPVKLACAALNPHAGENGFMGCEDEEVVKPTLRRLNAAGIDIAGPFPPDTLFIPGTYEKFDGIVCMYHDQGHIPFKMLAFDRGVNSTLGLPIIRTSPDHGTAFDIAGMNIADTGSMFAALRLAIKRVLGRKKC